MGQISLEAVLYQNGYLIIRENTNSGLFALKLPNKEISGAFKRAVQKALEKEDDYMPLHRKAKKSLQNLKCFRILFSEKERR